MIHKGYYVKEAGLLKAHAVIYGCGFSGRYEGLLKTHFPTVDCFLPESNHAYVFHAPLPLIDEDGNIPHCILGR